MSVAEGQPRAKPIGQMRVMGQGFSVHSVSSHQCRAICNKQPACDAANFHADKHKCRIFTRCSPRFIMSYNSSLHFYYAKRPTTHEIGYTYHPESDSCLKLIEKLADFAKADLLCREQGGRLVSLSKPGINDKATHLLRSSKAQFAWIGLTDSYVEGNPLHSDGLRVSDTGFFPLEDQGHRNDPTRNCWSLSDGGRWVEHNCKDRKQYSICQIVPY
ncbi:hypothetical protein AAG570_011709 [Ranatra chinensis]|uniref:C-type lectin domain-containing protein n=1 Tax=Ranatra chinensis TaxID=642074 RepID=A0ABD0YGY3_9HEMI